MPKSIPAALNTHLQLQTTTMALVWKITRRDGTVFGFTSHDQPIDADIDGAGLVTYEANTAITPTASRNTDSLSVDNLDVASAFDSMGITDDDLRVGRFDHADIKVALVNYKSPSDGAVRIRRGWLGEMRYERFEFITELRGLMQAYSQQIVDLTNPLCRVELGSPACGIRVAADGTWTASTKYTQRIDANDNRFGSVVAPTSFNDRFFICTRTGWSGTAEPAWNTTIGGTTTETVGATTWAATTAYNAGDRVYPTAGSAGFFFEAQNSGTSGGSEPTWPSTSEGQTVVDNDITWISRIDVAAEWETVRAHTISTSVATVTDNRTFTVNYTGDAEPADLQTGSCKFTSGNLSGTVHEIRDWDDGTKTVTLYLLTPLDIQVGDNVDLRFGCLKTISACQRFNNVWNFQGEPHLPTNDSIVQTPSIRSV